MVHTTVALIHGEDEYPIQIWHDSKSPFRHLQLTQIAYINYKLVPLFLVSSGPYSVYSEVEATETYFRNTLVAAAVNNTEIGLLAKFNDDLYAVFYTTREFSIKCFEINFGALEELRSLAKIDVPRSVYHDKKVRTDTTVFDRILENKLRNQYVVPRVPVPTPLSVQILAGDQISQAVNKVTLSGLRLRGLTTGSGSSNDKIAVRELYHMTKKSALFALRKYNYGFNGGGKSIRLSDVQDVVERLLQAYVDVD